VGIFPLSCNSEGSRTSGVVSCHSKMELFCTDDEFVFGSIVVQFRDLKLDLWRALGDTSSKVYTLKSSGGVVL
jgi:hypothetical protein